MTPTPERRRHPRSIAWLPLRLKVVGGKVETDRSTLVTKNFSKSGLSFFAPRKIEPGESIEVEVTLLGARPDGKNMYVSGAGSVVRTEPATTPGWYELAAVIDEPRLGGEPGWQKLAAAFDELPPSGKKS